MPHRFVPFRSISIFLSAALLISSQFACFSRNILSPEGGLVLLLFEKDRSDECEVMAEITTGDSAPDNFEEAQNVLRNAAADMGANAIIFESYLHGETGVGKALLCSETFVAAYREDRTVNPEDFAYSQSYQVSDHIVTNNSERLAWQRCSYGQYSDGEACRGNSRPFNWMSAINYCKTLDLEERRWRLPTIRELRQLSGPESEAGASIDQRLFPGTRNSVYWSSTLFEEKDNVIWVVDFENGESFGYGNSNMGYVRCVSDAD